MKDKTIQGPCHTNYHNCEDTMGLPSQADLCRVLGSDLYTEQEGAMANGPQTDEAREMEKHRELFQGTVLLNTKLDVVISK